MATTPGEPKIAVLGRLVQLNGLQAKPEYNGQLGIVAKYLPEKNR